MTIKITAENINALKEGDTLVKYPISGEPVSEIDSVDLKDFVFMQVERINDKTIDLVFPPIKTTIAGMGVVSGPLHKSKKSMIEDNAWWLVSK